MRYLNLAAAQGGLNDMLRLRLPRTTIGDLRRRVRSSLPDPLNRSNYFLVFWVYLLLEWVFLLSFCFIYFQFENSFVGSVSVLIRPAPPSLMVQASLSLARAANVAVAAFAGVDACGHADGGLSSRYLPPNL